MSKRLLTALETDYVAWLIVNGWADDVDDAISLMDEIGQIPQPPISVPPQPPTSIPQ